MTHGEMEQIIGCQMITGKRRDKGIKFVNGDQSKNSIPNHMRWGLLTLVMGAVCVGNLAQAGEWPDDDLRPSSIIGKSVRGRDGSSLGTIADLVINWRTSGYTQYAVLSSGGFLGLGEVYIVVPWVALAPSVNREYFVFNVVAHEEQEAARFRSYHFYDRSLSAGLHSGKVRGQSARVRMNDIDSSIPAVKMFTRR